MKFQINQVVFVYDPLRESIYECKIKDIIKGEDGDDFVYVLTPSNPHLLEVTLSKRHVHKTFSEAFQESLF